MKTTEVTAVIQCILTATQLSVLQNCCNKFLIPGLAGAAKISRIDKMNHCFFQVKYSVGCARKLKEVIKNRR